MAEKVIINNFQRGTSSSPYADDGAFTYSQGLDIHGQTGIARISEKLSKESGSTVTNPVKWMRFSTFDSSDTLYALGGIAAVPVVLYKSTDSGDTWSVVTAPGGGFSTGVGQGLEVWKDYLFVVGHTAIDVYGPLSGTPDWTNTKAWQTLSNEDTDWHPCKIGSDDILYIGHGNDVASVEEVSGQDFDPETGGTFTFTDTALDLPEGYKIRAIEESPFGLLMGTWKGTNIQDVDEATIFPWDRVSSTFNTPITLQEQGIQAMKNINGIVYVAAGISGKIYRFMGSYFQEITNLIKEDLSGGFFLQIYPDAIAEYQGRILIGTARGTNNALNHGVFSLVGKTVNRDYLISTGNLKTVDIASIHSLGNNSVIVGWADSTTYGIDIKSITTQRYTSYATFFESKVFRIGEANAEGDVSNLHIQLTRQLQTGEGVRVTYRTSVSDSYTTLLTFDFATYGAVDEIEFPFNITGQNLQLKVESTTGASSSNTPFLREITYT